MKDIINERLNRVENLEERKILKDIMVGVFSNIVEHQNIMNKNLEHRVFSEIQSKEKDYGIHITIGDRLKIDPIDEHMHPIILEDIKEKNIETQDVKKSLNNGESIKLSTIFMKCNTDKIRELLKNKRIYKGEMITNKKRYDIQIKLQQNKDYINEIEKLYHIFLDNNISWKTINATYLHKFFDIVLTQCDELSDDEEILEITFNLENYEKYKKINIIPIWNIKELKIKSSGFPIPAEDKINFEHNLNLEKLGMDKGYLIKKEEKEIKYIKFTNGELVIVSSEEMTGEWTVLQIIQSLNKKEYEYEVLSNSKKENFINNYFKLNTPIIRTKAEIERIINSFDVSKKFQLIEIDVIDKKDQEFKTYDMNYFIIDDIRSINKSKIMKLNFKTHKEEDYTTYDNISFIVSHIQMYFPEFKCVGELI